MMVPDKPENQTLHVIDGEITIQTNSCNDRLSGAQFSLWGLPFLLNLYPEPVQWSGGKLMGRGGMEHWFQTRDHKNRLVNSHRLTYTYPEQ